jgi:hypothetical protein
MNHKPEEWTNHREKTSRKETELRNRPPPNREKEGETISEIRR